MTALLNENRKADGSIVDLIVVRVVVDKTSKVVGVELKMLGKDAAQSDFVVVALGGLDGQSKEIG